MSLANACRTMGLGMKKTIHGRKLAMPGRRFTGRVEEALRPNPFASLRVPATPSTVSTWYASPSIVLVPGTPLPRPIVDDITFLNSEDDQCSPDEECQRTIPTSPSPPPFEEPKAKRQARRKRITIGTQTHVVQVATKCGHMGHPATSQATKLRKCPCCRLEHCLDWVRALHTKISETVGDGGDIMYTQEVVALKDMGRPGPLNFWKYDMLGNLKTIEKDGHVKQRRRGRWRTIKVFLANLLDGFREMAEEELRWEEVHGLKVCGHKAFHHSAQQALGLYNRLRVEVEYLPGDPVGEAIAKAGRRRCDREDVVGGKRKRRNGEEEELRPSKHVRFEEQVYTCTDIGWQSSLEPEETHQVPESTHITSELKDGPSRPQGAFKRHTTKYSPGPYASPEGYTRENTSWCSIPWTEMEGVLDEAEMERVTTEEEKEKSRQNYEAWKQEMCGSCEWRA